MTFLGIGDILQRILWHLPRFTDLKAKFLSVYRQKVDTQLGRTGARELARGIMKAGESAMDPTTGLGVEERILVGQHLFEQAAAQASMVPLAIRALSEAQAALERSRDGTAEVSARSAREAAELALTKALLNVQRAAVGDTPKG